MKTPWKHWTGAGLLALGCLLSVSCARGQEKDTKAEKEETATPDKAFIKRLQKLFSGDEEAHKKIVPTVSKYLQGQKELTKRDGQLAFQVATTLEQRISPELGREAYGEFSKILLTSPDEEVKNIGKTLEGANKRLDAVGHHIDIKGTTADGKKLDLAKLRGKVVLVDFWATWCGPCKAEIPNVRKLYKKYHDKGFDVIGVSLDEDKEKLENYVDAEKLPWPSIYDQDAKEGDRLADRYGVFGIPLAILVDREGTVVSIEARGEELTRLLAKLIPDKSESK